MSLEDMVEEYSKKWRVSKEEAQEKIRRILEDKAPSPDKLFPEPLGEISKKIQDINQAVLSTAYTKRLLTAPPEDVEVLKGKVERTESIVADLKATIEEKINKLTEVLNEKEKEKNREELMSELEARIAPINEGLQAIMNRLNSLEQQRMEQTPPSTAESQRKGITDIVTEAEKVENEAKTLLTKFGYRVEPDKLSREEIQKMIEEAQRQAIEKLPPDELKKRLESTGYKIVGGPITWDQFEKALEEARKRAQEEAIEDKRIDAVSGIIRDSITKVIDMFKPAVEGWLQAPPPTPVATPPTSVVTPPPVTEPPAPSMPDVAEAAKTLLEGSEIRPKKA